jgi:hypothetical protein
MTWWMSLLLGLIPIGHALANRQIFRLEARLHKREYATFRKYLIRVESRNRERTFGLGLCAAAVLILIGWGWWPTANPKAMIMNIAALMMIGLTARYWYRQPKTKIGWRHPAFPD